MKSIAGSLAAPFPYFGGKSLACATVWAAFGDVCNYVEPFAGSAAMLLGAPAGKRVETINDADGFVANFWRAVAADADAVAAYVDWPCNEVDLFARHSWLVRQRDGMVDRLHADPDYFDARIAGWWCWGACNWIGSGWCSGTGPWVLEGETLTDGRQLPHLSAGRGVNRQLPHLGNSGRGEYIREWFSMLGARLRDVRVACGDWRRVLTDSVTVRHGTTGVFLDPPYTKGSMDYAAGGVGGALADDVRIWCLQNGHRKNLRIVLCGHAGEHDALLSKGWTAREWAARKGYAVTDEAVKNSASETIWCSPYCMAEIGVNMDLFSSAE
jgi:DNA adenine methylase